MNPKNISPPQPIRWFDKIPSSPEHVLAEKDHIALLAQADLLQLIIQLFSLPSTETQIMLEKGVTDLQELLRCSNLPESDRLAEVYQQIRLQA